MSPPQRADSRDDYSSSIANKPSPFFNRFSSLLLLFSSFASSMASGNPSRGSLLDILNRSRKENPTHYQLAPLPFVGWYFRNSLRWNTIRLQGNISRKVRTTYSCNAKVKPYFLIKRKKSKKLLGSRIKQLTFRLYQISMRSCCLVWRLVSPAYYPIRSSHNNDTIVISVGPGVPSSR